MINAAFIQRYDQKSKVRSPAQLIKKVYFSSDGEQYTRRTLKRARYGEFASWVTINRISIQVKNMPQNVKILKIQQIYLQIQIMALTLNSELSSMVISIVGYCPKRGFPNSAILLSSSSSSVKSCLSS